jgi:hypothetical protein
MRYLKKFENFAGEEENSGHQAPVDGLSPETKEKIEDKINSFSPEELSKAQGELEAIASKLKLSIEDLQDSSKVEAALKSNPLNVSEALLNEGLSEWWSGIKNKVYSWMSRIGIVGVVGSLISLGIQAEMASDSITQADYTGATLNPSASMIYSGIALIISATAIAISMKNSKSTSVSTGTGANISSGSGRRRYDARRRR